MRYDPTKLRPDIDTKFVIVKHHEWMGDAFLCEPSCLFFESPDCATVYNDAESVAQKLEECRKDLVGDFYSVPVRVVVEELAAMPKKKRYIFDLFQRKIKLR